MNNLPLNTFWTLILLQFCAVVFGLKHDYQWMEWKVKHNKQYADQHEEYERYAIFQQNRAKINAHNRKYHAGMSTFSMALNAFADLTWNKFKHQYLGAKFNASNIKQSGVLFANSRNNKTMATSIDWRIRGAVTTVKDQERCADSWAFSAVGALEGQFFIKNNYLANLSAQQLIDCSSNFGNRGCYGGLSMLAFQYVMNYGIENEEQYPYEGKNYNCNYDPSKIILKTTNYSFVSNEIALQNALYNEGPISVGFDVREDFQFYSNGIYTSNQCKSTLRDHEMLLVAYNDEYGGPYWVVKNSWGKHWGEQGYARVINGQNMCGIATFAIWPIV